jgi:hypothetical protein
MLKREHYTDTDFPEWIAQPPDSIKEQKLANADADASNSW